MTLESFRRLNMVYTDLFLMHHHMHPTPHLDTKRGNRSFTDEEENNEWKIELHEKYTEWKK